RTEKPISHESLVCVVSGSFGSVVMCTVHIFCGPEFWVKVVCHKIGIYFGPLLWKKREAPDSRKRRHRLKFQPGSSSRRCFPQHKRICRSGRECGRYPNLYYLMPWMANGKTGSMAEAPPSTYSNWPVMKLAWSVHRRTTALPTSAGR